MSIGLYYRLEDTRKNNRLSYELKEILIKRYGGGLDKYLDMSDITYIEALVDAKIPDAEILLDALNKSIDSDIRLRIFLEN